MVLKRSSRKRQKVDYDEHEDESYHEASDVPSEDEASAPSASDNESVIVNSSRKRRSTKSSNSKATISKTSVSKKPRTKKQPSARPTTKKNWLTSKPLGDFDDVEETIAEDATLLASSLDPMEIEENPRLRHLQMFKNIVGILKVISDVKPTRDTTMALDTMLSGPVMNNNQWSHSSVKSSGKRWKCELRDHSKPSKVSARDGDLHFNETFTILKEDVSDKQVAEAIAQKYCTLMERLPFLAPRAGNSELKTFLVDVVARSVVTDFKIRLHGCYPSKGKNIPKSGPYYASRWMCVDPSTGKSSLTSFAIYTSKIDLNKLIPPLPAHVETADFRPSGNATTDEDRAKERHAYDLGNYIAFKMHNLFASNEALKMRKVLLMSQFLNTKYTRTGPYGGQRLYKYQIDIDSRSIRIVMSAAVRKSLENTTGGTESLPTIRVRGLSMARTQRVIQVLVQTWMRTGDILESWKAACTAADCLNLDVESGEDLVGSTCTCTPEQSKTECHACDLCGNVELCQALAFNASGTALTCNKCRERNPESIRSTLRNTIKREYLDLGIKHDSSTEIAEAIANIDLTWNPERRVWKSDYTQEELSDIQRTRGRETDPFMPSVDARFPVFYNSDRKHFRYHTTGNLSLCEQFLNYLKDIYPPGILHVVAEWLNSTKDETARKRLIKAIDDICVVRRKIPKGRLPRLTTKVTPSLWESTKQELLSCKPSSDRLHRKISAKLRQYFKKNLDPKWKEFKPRDISRIEQVIKEIEEYYASTGRLSSRSEDGCPFPFPNTEMPSNWCWWSAWALFSERLVRMWLWCNGHYITLDTIETLFLEAIVQFFEPTDVDPLMLDVLSIYYGNPLRFVIAKRIPDQAMHTSWKKPHPTSMSDRDFGTTGSSIGTISFEPHLSNAMKHNFAAKTYREMVRRVANINLSKECFDPDYKSQATDSGSDDIFADADFEDGIDDSLTAGAKLFEFGDAEDDDERLDNEDEEDGEVVAMEESDDEDDEE